MKKSWLYLLLSVVLLVLLAACNNDEESAGADAEDNTPKVENEEKETEEVVEAEVEVSVYPITYTDALGHEVVIDKKPERVISIMHVLYPDVLLALGIEPVGIADADMQFNLWEAYQPYVEKKKFDDIGNVRSPNMEKILELEPDLIMAAAGVHDQLYDQLAAIAPVVYLNQRAMSFDRELGITEISRMLGKEEAGTALLEEVNKKIADGRDKLASFTAKGESVVFTAATANGGFAVYGQNIAPTNPENGLGLQVPQGYPEDITQEVSMEGMSVLNPDHLFILLDKSGYTVAEDALKAYENNNVWKNINAVKNGNVYVVDRSLFAQDAPIATMYGVDVVVELLENK